MNAPFTWRRPCPTSPLTHRLPTVACWALLLAACGRPEPAGHERRALPQTIGDAPSPPADSPPADSPPADSPPAEQVAEGTSPAGEAPGRAAPPDGANQATTGTGAPSAGTAQLYGAPLSPQPKTDLGELLSHPEQFNGKTVLIEGHVRRACTRKGCWMEIATAPEDTAPGCRVTFKNYGFFVPTDSAGKSATVQATVKLSRVEASHVAHLESEGGTFKKKNPDGSADEIQLTASGVILAGG